MIAKLTRRGAEAVLNEDGTWSSSSVALATLLNSAFPKELYPPSPAAGVGCSAQARAAAAKLNADVEWPPQEEDDEGTVY